MGTDSVYVVRLGGLISPKAWMGETLLFKLSGLMRRQFSSPIALSFPSSQTQKPKNLMPREVAQHTVWQSRPLRLPEKLRLTQKVTMLLQSFASSKEEETMRQQVKYMFISAFCYLRKGAIKGFII